MRVFVIGLLLMLSLVESAKAYCHVPQWRFVWDTEGAAIMVTDGQMCRTSVSRVWNTSEVHAVTIASQPRHGTASTTGRGISYIPRAGYKGEDSFVFAVAGRKAGSHTRATVRVSVTVK